MRRHVAPVASFPSLGASLLGAALLGTALLGAACDKERTRLSRPEDDALHLPQLGVDDFHADAAQRPVEEKRVLPRTSPRTLDEAMLKETEVLEHLVELWWAGRNIHETKDTTPLAEVFAELREQVKSMDTLPPYTEAVRYALCRLGDGHLRVLDDEDAGVHYFSGLHFARAGDSIYVTSRSKGHGRGAGTTPQAGDELVSVDDTEVATWLDRMCLVPGSTPQHREAVALAGLRAQTRWPHEGAEPQEITLRRPGGETYSIEVDWQPTDTPGTGACVEAKVLDKKKKIGMLRLRTFWCRDADGRVSDAVLLDQLHKARKTLAKTKEPVVDLRGNRGGSEYAAERAAIAVKTTELEWTRVRHRRPYHATSPLEPIAIESHEGDPMLLPSKRLWVLVDSGCADSCELMAGALQGLDGVMLIGRTTAGSVGHAAAFRLPYSGITVAVPTTEHELPRSSLVLEGRGVVPDVEVIPTPQDLATGRDPDLEEALDRIAAG